MARVINEEDERFLTFKTSEVEFGGGRLTLLAKKIPLEYEAFVKIYEAVQNEVSANPETKTKRERKAKDTLEAATQETEVATEEATSSGDNSNDASQPDEEAPVNEPDPGEETPTVSEPPTMKKIKPNREPRLEFPSEFAGEIIYVGKRTFAKVTKKVDITGIHSVGGSGGKVVINYRTKFSSGTLELYDLGPLCSKSK
ncbi:hypothetical protein SBF1_5110001 [Candidatus Desulfosporosinus infrequens]|uniref:Uncharacterized protein n=1 Tax=Candidatus Desulfosporosinus infrequens TaxID=2043169 RepID=A0A2U3LI82_9FIRM|nr:hypothetical protein SBF1_5110001 [Candidatus Desulfosporosinus infrequens]